MPDHALHHDGHSHSETGATQFLGTAFWIALGILAAELMGGIISHSLALLSDAGHMLTDVLALGLSWFAARLASRDATSALTYGYKRAGILAALFNAVTLIAVSAAILVEAINRLRHPVPVTPWIMWGIAIVGLIGNLYLGLGLGAGHRHEEDLNVRGALLHVLGDAAASAGVLVAGILIYLTKDLWWDPVLSIGISLLIARSGWRVLKDTINVLMEATPADVNLKRVQETIEREPEALSCHHLHVWSLDGRQRMLSGHIVLTDRLLSATQPFVERVAHRLNQEFRITHVTLQLEGGEPCPDDNCD